MRTRIRRGTAAGLATLGAMLAIASAASAQVSVTIHDTSAFEIEPGPAAPDLKFQISTSGSSAPFQLNYRTVDGTAVAGEDFVGAEGSVMIVPNGGSAQKRITVDVIDDALIEGLEEMTVELLPSPGVTIEDGEATGFIWDDGDGEFACRASALTLLTNEPVVANGAAAPCAGQSREQLGLPLGGPPLPVFARVLGADTVMASDGRSASAHAEVAKLSIGAITAAGLVADAQASCRPNEGTSTSASSSLAELRVNGVPVAVGAAPLSIPLGVGTLHLNYTSQENGRVVRRALWLDTPSGDVVAAEAIAGVRGQPCPPEG